MAAQFDALPMLYEQHRLYTDELGSTHAGLGKLYKKLTKVERKLKDSCDAKLPRNQIKKLWWTRNVSKQSIEKLESEKTYLYDRLQQCRDLITSYHHDAYMATTPAFWSTYFPPTPFAMTPFTPYPPTPWTIGPHLQPCYVGQEQRPQYWDLSMLNDHSAEQTDSAYHSSELSSQATGEDHTYTHELVSTPSRSAAGASMTSKIDGSYDNSGQAEDIKNTTPTKIDTGKANEHVKRRYSETIVEHRPSVVGHARTISAVPELC